METLVGNWHKMEMMMKSSEKEIQQLRSTIRYEYFFFFLLIHEFFTN
jgi:hypothetical protein